MTTCVHQIGSLDDLRDYIYTTICNTFDLQLGAYQMGERVLYRGGRPCGLYFVLHGPRGMKFTAIWETERNQVLFYGPTGERFQRTQLIEAPQLECAAA